MTQLLAALLLIWPPGGGGAGGGWGIGGGWGGGEWLAYRRQNDAIAQARAVLATLRYVLAGLSNQPSDSDLNAAVTMFWKSSGGLAVSSTILQACYPWEGSYIGHGRPTVCRYTVVFNELEESRATIESGFDNDEADHWYLTTAFGSGQTCVGCPKL